MLARKAYARGGRGARTRVWSGRRYYSPYQRWRVPAALKAPRNEMKCWDDSISTAFALPAVTSFTPVLLNRIHEGTAAYEHVGRQISMQSIAFEAEYYLPTGGSASVRTMIVYDRQSNSAPTSADLLTDNNSIVQSFNSGVNMKYRDRFLVLRDDQITLDDGSGLSKHYETYVKRPLAANYDHSADDTVTYNPLTGAVYLIQFARVTQGATYPSCSTWHCRVRFVDA